MGFYGVQGIYNFIQIAIKFVAIATTKSFNVRSPAEFVCCRFAMVK